MENNMRISQENAEEEFTKLTIILKSTENQHKDKLELLMSQETRLKELEL